MHIAMSGQQLSGKTYVHGETAYHSLRPLSLLGNAAKFLCLIITQLTPNSFLLTVVRNRQALREQNATGQQTSINIRYSSTSYAKHQKPSNQLPNVCSRYPSLIMNRPGVFPACSGAIVALSSAQVNHYSDHQVLLPQPACRHNFALPTQRRNILYHNGVIRHQPSSNKMRTERLPLHQVLTSQVMQRRRGRVGQELQVQWRRAEILALMISQRWEVRQVSSH
ncbi:uncharacterized protein BJ212DRAFT_824209 [Suillus subaureus]|uniref:Uncharacterized protein n=1 Tax=Suillus subaureus TaxID=48587 RepID=A0A9P7EJF1_9AGAM|nr:uncharacterized protein BJ212DRAFT_658965 [Suillus subaureus]XP_041197122.1 uncharacterized protein BJ212DRAFT_824209 [Suillus subaureus]KAG1794485.1 hypothetical protein BJ212DRAFT_658965 [Suillus subaureus]KAG1822716.1 hypothetical protein BJ212DRAFT_824209 [Suillus subaureus]